MTNKEKRKEEMGKTGKKDRKDPESVSPGNWSSPPLQTKRYINYS